LVRATGHDVLWAAESQPGALDAEWAALAEREGRIVVTEDKVFGEIVYRDRLSRCGVNLLRFDDIPVAAALARLQAVWSVVEANPVGQFIVFTENKVRVRPLPEGLFECHAQSTCSRIVAVSVAACQ
jgi:predicted nuclease of predicted toxin-antitoxin system